MWILSVFEWPWMRVTGASRETSSGSSCCSDTLLLAGFQTNTCGYPDSCITQTFNSTARTLADIHWQAWRKNTNLFFFKKFYLVCKSQHYVNVTRVQWSRWDYFGEVHRVSGSCGRDLLCQKWPCHHSFMGAMFQAKDPCCVCIQGGHRAALGCKNGFCIHPMLGRPCAKLALLHPFE